MLSLDSLPDTLAFAIYEFIKGLDTDEHLLIQAIVPYSNSIMREIADSYRKRNSHSLLIYISDSHCLKQD